MTRPRASATAPWREILLFASALALLGLWSLAWARKPDTVEFMLALLTRPRTLAVIAGLHLVALGLVITRAAAAPASRKRTAQLAGLCALGVVTAAATVNTAKQSLLLQGSDLLSEKLRQYDRIAEDVDTVFLGSSRIYRHFDPNVYDETRKALGSPGLSFNLGVPDMRMLEALHIAEWLFERSTAIKTLIVEVEPNPLELPEWNRRAARTVAWHDQAAMARIRRGIQSLPEKDRTAVLAAHLEPFQRNQAATGRALNALGPRSDKPRIDPKQRGYQSLEQNRLEPISPEEAQELEQRWNRLHQRPGRWQQTLAELRRTEAAATVTDPFELELFAELEGLAKANNAKLIWLISPSPRRRPNIIAAHQQGVVKTLLRFDDPKKYPDFYQANGRYDRHHLNSEMAKRITRLVAAELGAAP